MTLDGLIASVQHGGFSGWGMSLAIVYLAVEVRGLKQSFEKVLPILEDHSDRIARLEERTK